MYSEINDILFLCVSLSHSNNRTLAICMWMFFLRIVELNMFCLGKNPNGLRTFFWRLRQMLPCFRIISTVCFWLQSVSTAGINHYISCFSHGAVSGLNKALNIPQAELRLFLLYFNSHCLGLGRHVATSS